MNTIPFKHHLSTLAQWLNALPGMRGWDADWVRRKTLADPDHDPALVLAAQVQGEPAGFVVGTVRGGQGWIKALLVRPDRQRQGVGSELLRAVEDRFAQRGVTQVIVGWVPLSYITPGVDVRFTAATAFLERHGYCTDRVSRVNLDVALAGRDFGTVEAEKRLAAEGITVERAKLTDMEAIGQLADAEGSAMWRDESGQAYHSVSGPGEFGPMLTAASLRGQGIGVALLRRCLADLQRLGYRRAEIIWAGPISFYAKVVDACVGRVFWEWKKTARP